MTESVFAGLFSAAGRSLIWGAAIGMALGVTASRAETEAADNPDQRLLRLKEMSLEEVLHSEVTSVSKRPEQLFGAAAAISVITGEEIQRSGARSLAEALRLAPGLGVAQLDANKWAIAARGFNDRFSNRLLVLMDGRTIFSPSDAGVRWDVQDYLLEDIERIEVVRGPGGTLWGGNAVNGVINIVTKGARNTEGVFLTGGGGTAQRGFAGGRYGVKLTDDTFMRGYVNYRAMADHPDGFDGWDQIQTGMRLDREKGQGHFTLQGDYYHATERQVQIIPRLTPVPNVVPVTYLEKYPERYKAGGANVLGRYTHTWSEDAELQVQAYVDHTERGEVAFAQQAQLYDVEMQHRFALPGRQSFMYGVGYRYLPDHYVNAMPEFLAFIPDERHRQLFSTFLQDEVTLVEDRLKLTLGTKLEHADFSGWQVQPNVRLAWTPNTRQTIWGAVSRAVTQPGRNARDIVDLIPSEPMMVNGLPMFVRGYGSEETAKPQAVIAYELGYRQQLSDKWSLDLSTFYNDYTRLVKPLVGTPVFVASPVPHLELPISSTGGGRGTGIGGETALQWHPNDWWHLSGAYSFLSLELTEVSEGSEGRYPEHQFSLRSSMDLPANLFLDLWGRYVTELSAFGVPGYFDLDVRLAWRPNPQVEVAIVGQNLIESKRIEFGPNDYLQTVLTAVPRGVYGQVSIRF
jgi:iron complex outermembrane receptor protein